MHLWDPSSLYWRDAIYWPPRFESSDSTIPFNLLVTTASLDVVYICNNIVVLIELTIPFNSPESLNGAQSGLFPHWIQVTQELLRVAWFVFCFVKLWWQYKLGHLATVFHHAASPLREHYWAFWKSKTRDLFDSAARTAISVSYVIFLARKNSHLMSDRMHLTWNVCFTYV